MSTCHRRKAGRKRCRVGTMSLATSCDITRHHAIGRGSGWRKTSFVRRRCRRETRWRERKRKAGGSRKRKWKTGGCWKRKGFPLQLRPVLTICGLYRLRSGSVTVFFRFCNRTSKHYYATGYLTHKAKNVVPLCRV